MAVPGAVVALAVVAVLVGPRVFEPSPLAGGAVPVDAIEVDGKAPLPGPDSRKVAVLVTESNCNSGAPATGRVRVLSLESDSAAVRVEIGIVPRRLGDGDGVTCLPNSPTPFVLDIKEPLGMRQLINVGARPPQVVLPAGGMAGKRP